MSNGQFYARRKFDASVFERVFRSCFRVDQLLQLHVLFARQGSCRFFSGSVLEHVQGKPWYTEPALGRRWTPNQPSCQKYVAGPAELQTSRHKNIEAAASRLEDVS